MLTSIGILSIVLLATANGQMFSMGNCDPNLKTMPNFNNTMFIGKWYEIMKSPNTAKPETKCLSLEFKPLLSNKHDIYKVEATYLHKKDSQQKQASYYIIDDEGHGPTKFRPGYLTDEQPIIILDTDYDRYAIFYSCLNSYNGKLEYVWIHSRQTKQNDSTVTKVKNSLKTNNITLKIFKYEQTCE